MTVALSDPETAAAYTEVILGDLGRLNHVQAGLGDRAAAYVLTGRAGPTRDDDDVLSVLATQATENVLQLGLYRGDSATADRRVLMARAHPYDVEIMQRYAQVLSALAFGAGHPPLRFTLGSPSVPAKARLFFAEAFLGLIAMPNRAGHAVEEPLQGRGLEVEKALQMLHGMGGTRADFLDVLYFDSSPLALSAGRAYRSAAKLPAWLAGNPAAVEEGMTRLSVAARAALVNDLKPGTQEALAAHPSTPGQAGSGEQGYIAIDGRHISIPPRRALQDGPAARFSDADASALEALMAAHNAVITQRNALGARSGSTRTEPLLDPKEVPDVMGFLNGEGGPPQGPLRVFLAHGGGARWLCEALQRLPEARAIPLLRRLALAPVMQPRLYDPLSQRVDAYLLRSDADLRTLEALDVAAGKAVTFEACPQDSARPARNGDFLRTALQAGSRWSRPLSGIRHEALWPYLAENLAVLDEAFGLVPSDGPPLDRAAALEQLAQLPATPARYYEALLEIGTAGPKSLCHEARALLSLAPGLEGRLVELLTDSRQDVRAAAAQWLGSQGADQDAHRDAIAALGKRLKVEKLERVRAALLTALARLGADISPELGLEVLLAQAQKGLKSVKGNTLPFLSFKDLAPLQHRDGRPVPEEVLRWWCQMALKLKQPGGHPLLGIYLEQLKPSCAEAFSAWVLDSWIGYDTARLSEEDASALARAAAAQFIENPHYAWYYDGCDPGDTEDEVFEVVKANFVGQQYNSGAASKAVLALAIRTPPALAAERVRSYLKSYGERTSQAGALLELLAGIGDPVALQVLIAASIRLKQKSLQKLAGELVSAVAQERQWTPEELADRTIPAAGFDSGGLLALPCGEERKPYEARLTASLAIKLRNPAGKEVASLPAGGDAVTQDAKKQLSSARKLLKQIITLQSSRLYEAFCVQRSWASEDWLRSFHAHPVMGRLIQQLVWVGVAGGGATATFRPTQEGDFVDAQDRNVDVAAFRQIRLACGALLEEPLNQAWLQHLEDYVVVTLFRQLGRALLKPTIQQGATTAITDRLGWVIDALNLRSSATRQGYERGPVEDGGVFREYRKAFPSIGLTAVISFSGSGLPEEALPVALKELRFRSIGSTGLEAPLRLAEVPEVLLSECWHDYHGMAAKAEYDPDWEKKARW